MNRRESMLIVTPDVGFCGCSMSSCALLYVHSGFAIILMGKRELAILLSWSSWCLVSVVWLIHVVPWLCLKFVILTPPGKTWNPLEKINFPVWTPAGVQVFAPWKTWKVCQRRLIFLKGLSQNFLSGIGHHPPPPSP